MVHCKGYQKGDPPEVRGDRVADLATREVVLKPMELPQVLMALLEPSVPGHPQYTPGYN